MKKIILMALVLLAGCGGSLSEDQRKKLRDGMEDQKIQRVTNSEIVSKALDQGRDIFEALKSIGFDTLKQDSIASAFHARVRWITPGSGSAKEVENQVIQAYVVGAETGATQDNIQELRISPDASDYDSLLYSRPVVSPVADGSINVKGVWNIYLSKKQLIRKLGKD